MLQKSILFESFNGLVFESYISGVEQIYAQVNKGVAEESKKSHSFKFSTNAKKLKSRRKRIYNLKDNVYNTSMI